MKNKRQRSLQRIMGSDLRKLAKKIRKQGVEVSLTNGGHLRFERDGKVLMHTGSTPSDHRAMRALKAQLAREGIET